VRDWAKIESERKRGCFSFLEEERIRAIASISFYSENLFSASYSSSSSSSLG
jgi:hypothetical protein